ncbi:hypothetical protein, partial [Enterococcus faecalis]|uniref:hypothetical protein n=1 Tax=Enterococcus faecalis TaxID=1351 RepID=UPI003D6A179C
FPQHAQTMDAGLALHLKSVGYDPATGHISEPESLPALAISGCGGSCGSGDGEAKASPAEPVTTA